MIKVLLLTIAIIGIVAIGACIGIIFKREPLKGSCGGLTALGFEKACACKEPCDEFKEKEATLKFKQLKAKGKVKVVDKISNPDLNYADNREGEGVFKAGDIK